jgi:hypothetical protein
VGSFGASSCLVTVTRPSCLHAAALVPWNSSSRRPPVGVPPAAAVLGLPVMRTLLMLSHIVQRPQGMYFEASGADMRAEEVYNEILLKHPNNDLIHKRKVRCNTPLRT